MFVLAGQPFLRYSWRWPTEQIASPSGPTIDTVIEGELRALVTMAFGKTSLMKRTVASRSWSPPSHELQGSSALGLAPY